MFQHYALFRHMTVFENVAFGLRVRRWPEARVRDRVRELLALVRLEEKAKEYPAALSGGQKQRIALVRALAPEPRVLLLDEPFGALDAKVRAELRHWLRRFHDQVGVTTIFVTHDQEEAFEVADKVVVMNRGRVEQQGAPLDVFEHPATAFVMDFLGNVNKLPVRMEGGRALLGDTSQVEVPGKVFRPADGGRADVYVRPHELDVSQTARRRQLPAGPGAACEPGRGGRQGAADGRGLRPGHQRGRVARAVPPPGPAARRRRVCDAQGRHHVRAGLHDLKLFEFAGRRAVPRVSTLGYDMLPLRGSGSSLTNAIRPVADPSAGSEPRRGGMS